MTHEITHIICGTGGAPVTDKTITVYDAPFSVAIKIDANELEAQSIAAGMSPEKAKKRVDKFVAMVEKDWEAWGDFLEFKLCVYYERHEPHSQS